MSAGTDLFLSRLEGVRKTPSGWRAFCPAHQRPPHKSGRGRTLSVSESAAGGTLARCHAGCSVDEIVRATGLDMSCLFPPLPSAGASEIKGCKGIKGWDWWSLASALDAVADEVRLSLIQVVDAYRAGDLVMGHAALSDALTSLLRLESDVKSGKGVRK